MARLTETFHLLLCRQGDSPVIRSSPINLFHNRTCEEESDEKKRAHRWGYAGKVFSHQQMHVRRQPDDLHERIFSLAPDPPALLWDSVLHTIYLYILLYF